MITCKCPHCKTTVRLGDEFAGQEVLCGSCRRPFGAPAASVPPPAADAAPRARPAMPAAGAPHREKSGTGRFLLICLLVAGMAGTGLLLLHPQSPLNRRSGTVAAAGEQAQTKNGEQAPNVSEEPKAGGADATIPKPASRPTVVPARLTDSEEEGETPPSPENNGTSLTDSSTGVIPGLIESDAATQENGGAKYAQTLKSDGVTTSDVECRDDLVERLQQALTHDNFRLTPRVREAYFDVMKAKAADDLKAMSKNVPTDFLKWIDGDPEVRATVYGAKLQPANLILMLYGLQLDTGEKTIRANKQLALAAAVVHADKGPWTDTSPRKPMKLEIPTCALKPVDTRDKKRELDVNDHIINFLNEDYKLYRKTAPRHIKDGCISAFRFRGADDLPDPKGLTATDVIKDDGLKDALTDYLKKKGTPVEFPHGGVETPATYKNFETLHNAYVAKGLLPGDRDPRPTPAQRLLYLAQIAPHSPFPMKTTPWPVMTLLFEEALPLRECDEIWREYRRNKRFITYGNYVGPIAQNATYLAASDLRPFPFSAKNRSWQTMIKNGGVCGTMAAIAVGTYNATGIPSCTAGQPGHCALISYSVRGRKYGISIEQSVTGGPYNTTCGPPPLWDRPAASANYVSRESVAAAMNLGLGSYLDSNIMYGVFRVVKPDFRDKYGFDIIAGGLRENPYNIMLVDTLSETGTPCQLVRLYTELAGKRINGTAMTGIYRDKFCRTVTMRLNALPTATKPGEAETVCNFLRDVHFPEDFKPGYDEMALLLKYQKAALGADKFMAALKEDYGRHLNGGSPRTPASCQKQAGRIALASALLEEDGKEKRDQWLMAMFKMVSGHEDYSATGHLEIDRRDKETGRPANFIQGEGQLVAMGADGKEYRMHFHSNSEIRLAKAAARAMQARNSSSAFSDGNNVARLAARADTSVVRRYFNPEKGSCDATTVLRDESADRIAELLGMPSKKHLGVSLLFTDPKKPETAAETGAGATVPQKEAKAVYEFMKTTNFEEPALIFQYAITAEGADKFMEEQYEKYKAFAASQRRNELACRNMAECLSLIAQQIPDGDKKTAWLAKLQGAFKGRENYTADVYLKIKDDTGHPLKAEEQVLTPCKRRKFHDPTADVIAKLLGLPPPPDTTSDGAAETGSK